MSKPIVLKYDAPVSNYIANSQNVADGEALILNGSSPYSPVPTGPIVFNGLQRYITLTSNSAADNSDVTFVITGTQLNSPAIVTENLVGPTGNAGLTPSVTSANQYHSIISIVATTNIAAAISAGTGIGATFAWITCDLLRQVAQYSFQGVIRAGNASYSILQTLDDPQGLPNSITSFAVNNTVVTPLTANTFYSFQYPVTGLQLVVNTAGTNAAGALTFTLLQQGVY